MDQIILAGFNFERNRCQIECIINEVPVYMDDKEYEIYDEFRGEMIAKVKDREINKFYLCVCHGVPSKKEDLLVDYLIKDEDKNQVKVFDRQVPGSKEIKTLYKVLKTGKNMSLLEVELLTGRTHQIRAHLAFIGCPLVGDGKYGSNALNKKLGYKKQFLYSYKLQFDFTTDAGILEYLNGKEFIADDVWFAKEFPNF